MSGEYAPSLVSWNLTRACNLRCPHCYMEGGTKAENELSTVECLSLIDELKDLGTEMLILTGGEPLLRKDIFEIARYAVLFVFYTVILRDLIDYLDAVGNANNVRMKITGILFQ